MSNTSEKEKAQTQSLQDRLDKALAENAKLKSKVSAQAEELQAKEATKGTSLPTKKIGEKHYVATAKNTHVIAPNKETGKRESRGIMSAEEILKDDALCAHLVKIGSHFLMEVDKWKAKQEAKRKKHAPKTAKA